MGYRKLPVDERRARGFGEYIPERVPKARMRVGYDGFARYSSQEVGLSDESRWYHAYIASLGFPEGFFICKKHKEIYYENL